MQRDDGPHDLDETERPCARQESVAAREQTAGCKGQHESIAPALHGVHQHHETDRNDAIQRYPHGESAPDTRAARGTRPLTVRRTIVIAARYTGRPPPHRSRTDQDTA